MNQILVIGAARSGVACAEFLVKLGKQVILTDMNEAIAEKIESQLGKKNITYIWGIQPDISTLEIDCIIMSPGVPMSIPPVLAAKEKKIPIISEPELAFLYAKAPFVGITGTNGKTTTTTLVANLLETPSRKVLCAGNIGLPLISEAPLLRKEDIIVAELSSFQLENVVTFKPKVAIYMNLTPDHLDRHGNMETYGSCKANIFRQQSGDDVLIYNADDLLVEDLAKKAPARVLAFSQKKELVYGMWLKDGNLMMRLHGQDVPELLMPRVEVKLAGAHNIDNVMAASLAALVMGQDKTTIVNRLRIFEGVAHRMEPVGVINRIHFVNDSKGTNPDATMKALNSYEHPIVAILGGRNKGNDFTELAELVKKNCRQAILLGEAIPDFQKAFKNVSYEHWQVASDFADAVFRAYRAAEADDIVLLSPACASWDMFNNFEERGDYFKKLVKEIEKEFCQK